MQFSPRYSTLLQWSALALLAIVLTNPLGNFPLNDDWQYAYPVKALIEEGRLEVKGVFAPNVLLQIGWGYLFCGLFGSFDFTWLRLSTLCAAIIGLAAFFSLLKALSIEKKMAALLCLVLAFNPLFFSLAFTFMSDVPFLALCLLSILAFFRHIQHSQNRWLAVACCWAICAYCVRQPGILLIPSFALFRLVEERSWNRFISAVLLIIVAVASYTGMEHWLKPWLGISENYVAVSGKYLAQILQAPFSTLLEWFKKLLKTGVYLGFFTIPFLPFLWQRIREGRLLSAKFLLGAFVVNIFLLWFMFASGKVFPFGGNVLYNFGLGPELLADVYTLGLQNTPKLPNWVMMALSLAGQMAFTFFVFFITGQFKRLGQAQRRFACFLLLFNLLYLPAMSITSFFDRYLLLPIASFLVVLGLVADFGISKIGRLKYLLLVITGLFSVAGTHDYLSWNRARKAAVDSLVSRGVSFKEMDAGYEYNGFYNYFKDRQEVAGRSFWWVNDDTYIVTFGPVRGYEELDSSPYHRWLFFRKDTIHVLKRKP